MLYLSRKREEVFTTKSHKITILLKIDLKCLLGAHGGIKITDENIIPSLHIYPISLNWFKKRAVTTDDIDKLAEAGRSLIICEFGPVWGSGWVGKLLEWIGGLLKWTHIFADWSGIVKHAQSKGYTVLGWAWNGDGDSSKNMVCCNFSFCH